MNDAARMQDPGAASGPGRRVVIVGGGQAAGAALRKLRDLHHAGEVTLISDEPHVPYERPPLSKAYLWGEEQEVRCIAPGCLSHERVLLDRKVVSADPEARTITCGDGSRIRYDALLLATGGHPRRLSVPGGDLAHVHALRTAADAAALRRSIADCAASGRPLLVVGGSWIGLEVAAGARKAGVGVVLLELGERLCGRTLPATEAQWLQSLHSAQGVDIRLRTSVLRLEGEGAVQVAHLSDGSLLQVGAVVVGIGIAPNVSLAEQCGVLIRSGVVVDGHGRTSVPHIYAAGDVTEQGCNWHDAAVRIETWDNANRQGEAAAAHIASQGMGAAMPAASFSVPPPWFWSDQYGMNLQVVGAPLRSDTVLANGDAGNRLAVYLRDDIVVGAIGVNRPRDVRLLRKLLGSGVPLNRDALLRQGILG